MDYEIDVEGWISRAEGQLWFTQRWAIITARKQEG